MPALFLASTSPRRRELLRAAGFAPILLAPTVEESSAAFLSPRELVALNAYRKLRGAVAAGISALPQDAVVVAADTLVYLSGTVLGKPRDISEANDMLTRLSGRTHQVFTGLALWQLPRPNRPWHCVERTDVRFRRLSPAAIKHYLSRIEPLDKAGGYSAQEHGREIIASVEGSWTNVIGLPMERLTLALARLGIRPGTPASPG